MMAKGRTQGTHVHNMLEAFVFSSSMCFHHIIIIIVIEFTRIYTSTHQ